MSRDGSSSAVPAESLAERKSYPLFVVHAAPDTWFVRGVLLPALGLSIDEVQLTSAPPLGQPVLSFFERGVADSELTVVVLSRAFVADEWAQHAELLASHAAAVKQHAVVPLFLDELSSPMWRRLRVSLDLRERQRWDGELARLAALVAEASGRAARSTPPGAVEELACPYPGMRSLAEGDGALLFGREQEIEDIVARLFTGARELYLIGPSGSGKSSLVSAGVVPRLLHGAADRRVVVARRFRPGEAPSQRLTEAKAAVEACPPGRCALLVVDQLEEAFALAGDEERAAFFAGLRALRADPRCLLLFCLRADFLGELMGSPLWDEERTGHLMIGALRRDALQKAIEVPALSAGVYLEPGLTERLLADAGSDAGVLPILQETLRQLWELRRRRVISLASYEAMGGGGKSGLAVAMSRRADACLQALSAGQHKIARRILLRLVCFGQQGAADTRRPQPRSALRLAGEPLAELDRVLSHLSESRLVTLQGGEEPILRRQPSKSEANATGRRAGSRGEALEEIAEDDDGGFPEEGDPAAAAARVELVHEALIKSWEQLAGWIEDRRAAGQRRRHLEEAASAWVGRGRGTGGLLEARELSEARTWRTTEDARELGESQQLRQLFSASGRALRRQRWRRIAAITGISVVTLAGVLALGVFVAGKRAELARSRAEAQERAEEASVQRAENQLLGHRVSEQGAALDETKAKAAELVTSAAVATAEAREHKKHRALLSQTVTNQQVDADQEKARRALLDGHPQQALPHLLAALGKGSPSPLLQMMLRASTSVWQSHRLAHADEVLSVAISGDGSRVATASADGSARLWDSFTGDPSGARLKHGGAVVDVAFSPDGSLLATASVDGHARLWYAATGALVATLRHGGEVRVVRFSSDGKLVLTASADHTAQLWSVTSGAAVGPALRHDGGVRSAELSADGALVVTGGDDRSARVWNAASGEQLAKLAHPGPVASVAFDREGERVVTISGERAALWDWRTGQRAPGTFGHRGGVQRASLSPDGARLATAGDDGTARIWDARAKRTHLLSLQHGAAVSSVQWSRDGKRLITTSADRSARIWDALTGRPLSPVLEHDSEVKRALLDNGGTFLVTASGASFARLWIIERWLEPRSALEQPPGVILDLAFSPDGKRLVAAGRSQRALVWSVDGAARIAALHHGGVIEAVAWSPDGALLAIGGGGAGREVQLWNPATGVLQAVLPHGRVVVDLAFSADGQRLYTASKDLVRAWSPVTAREEGRFAHPGEVTALALSTDGGRLLTACSDGQVRLWSTHTRAQVMQPLPFQGELTSGAIRPGSGQLAAAGESGRVVVWSAAGKQVFTIDHEAAVSSVRYSPDGAFLSTASRQPERVRIWNAGNGDELVPPVTAAGAVRALAWSADNLLAIGGHSRRVELWDLLGEPRPLTEWRDIASRSGFRLVLGKVVPVPLPAPPDSP